MIAAGTAVAVVLLGGCARDAEPAVEVDAVWRAQIDQVLASGVLTDEERRILEDYWVSDAEYAQLREPIPGCLAERGFRSEVRGDEIEIWADPDVWGGHDLDHPEVDAALTAAERECMDRLFPVEAFYWDMRNNPEGWDYHEALVRCAERVGLDEARGMTGEEIEAAMREDRSFASECRIDPWAVAQGSPPPEGDWEDTSDVVIELTDDMMHEVGR